MDLSKLFAQFVKEKPFLLNVTPKTIRWYWQSWNAFTRNVGIPEYLDRFVLNEFVMKLKESGINATSVNVYVCGINSFLSWLWENNLISERLKIKYLKEEKKVIQTFSDAQIKALIHWKPKDWHEWRLHAPIGTETSAKFSRNLIPPTGATLRTARLALIALIRSSPCGGSGRQLRAKFYSGVRQLPVLTDRAARVKVNMFSAAVLLLPGSPSSVCENITALCVLR